MLLSAGLLDIQDKFQPEKIRNWWACEYTYKESWMLNVCCEG